VGEERGRIYGKERRGKEREIYPAFSKENIDAEEGSILAFLWGKGLEALGTLVLDEGGKEQKGPHTWMKFREILEGKDFTQEEKKKSIPHR